MLHESFAEASEQEDEQQALRDVLNVVDNIVGKYVGNLGVGADPKFNGVLLYGECRTCKEKYGADYCTLTDNWVEKLVEKFAREVNKHNQKHQIIIPGGSRWQ